MRLSLQQIQELAKSQGIESSREQLKGEFPLEVLYISLGKDDQERDLVAQLNYTEPVTEEQEGLEFLPHLLQFFVSLPIFCKEATRSDTMRLIFLINSLLELPGFAYNEKDQTLYYRYVFSYYKTPFSGEELTTLLRTFQLYVRLFSPMFEDIATQKKSFEEILKESEEAIKDLKP